MSEKTETLRRIIENYQYEKIDGVIVDAMTADAIITIYDAVNETNKAKFIALPIEKMAKVAWQLVNKIGG